MKSKNLGNLPGFFSFTPREGRKLFTNYRSSHSGWHNKFLFVQKRDEEDFRLEWNGRKGESEKEEVVLQSFKPHADAIEALDVVDVKDWYDPSVIAGSGMYPSYAVNDKGEAVYIWPRPSQKRSRNPSPSGDNMDGFALANQFVQRRAKKAKASQDAGTSNPKPQTSEPPAVLPGAALSGEGVQVPQPRSSVGKDSELMPPPDMVIDLEGKGDAALKDFVVSARRRSEQVTKDLDKALAALSLEASRKDLEDKLKALTLENEGLQRDLQVAQNEVRDSRAEYAALKASKEAIEADREQLAKSAQEAEKKASRALKEAKEELAKEDAFKAEAGKYAYPFFLAGVSKGFLECLGKVQSLYPTLDRVVPLLKVPAMPKKMPTVIPPEAETDIESDSEPDA